MSGEPNTTVLIEKSIWRRANGRYTVRVRANSGRASSWIRHTVDTLKEAREIRDARTGKRKVTKNGRVIDQNVSGIKRINSTGYVPTDVLEQREELKNRIKSAPRSTILRDGKKYTLISLPEVEATHEEHRSFSGNRFHSVGGSGRLRSEWE